MVDKSVIDPFGEEIWEPKQILKISKGLEAGYVYLPYILVKSEPIIEFGFFPKTLIRSRYTTVTTNNFLTL